MRTRVWIWIDIISWSPPIFPPTHLLLPLAVLSSCVTRKVLINISQIGCESDLRSFLDPIPSSLPLTCRYPSLSCLPALRARCWILVREGLEGCRFKSSACEVLACAVYDGQGVEGRESWVASHARASSSACPSTSCACGLWVSVSWPVGTEECGEGGGGCAGVVGVQLLLLAQLRWEAHGLDSQACCVRGSLRSHMLS